MSGRKSILAMSAQVKAHVLSCYGTYGDDFARDLGRRIIFDVGEAMGDMRGRAEAASAIYQVADRITCKLPLEDWQTYIAPVAPKIETPAAKPEAPPAPAAKPSGLRRILAWVERHESTLWFYAGLIAGLGLGGR